MLIEASTVADAKMRFFNLDGSEGKMAGNAIRCVAKFLYDNKIVKKLEMDIETLSGVKHLELFEENGKISSVKVDMGKAELNPGKIPVNLPGDSVIAAKVEIAGNDYEITCVSMGNPHCIVYVDDVDRIDIEKIGPLFEFDPLFPERVNTEFVTVIDKNTIKMRVWERGAGETLACGTGACAAVVAGVLNGLVGRSATVQLRGGDLEIEWSEDDNRVYLTGDAVTVFEGEIKLDE